MGNPNAFKRIVSEIEVGFDRGYCFTDFGKVGKNKRSHIPRGNQIGYKRTFGFTPNDRLLSDPEIEIVKVEIYVCFFQIKLSFLVWIKIRHGMDGKRTFIAVMSDGTIYQDLLHRKILLTESIGSF